MSNKPPVNLSAMNRAFFEGLNSGARLELLCRLHAMTAELAERLGKNSTNTSEPPSADSPFGGLPSKGEGGQKDDVKDSAAAKPWTPPSAPPRRPGKQPGAKGKWRCEALTGERTENHYQNSCGICGATLELWHDNRGYSGHFVLDLERLPSGIRVACVLHRYHVVCCPCGKETVASPAKGLVSAVDGRKRDLRPDRGEPRGAGAGHFHRRFVGALPAVARQDRGASRDMARRTVVGGQHRPLHSRSRSRLRAGCRGFDRGSAPVRGHQRRRDAMAAAWPSALALGRLEFDDRRVQDRQPAC